MPRILPFSPSAVAEAAALIRAGEPVAIGTETVYGLAADATRPDAVARIYEIKGRPSFNPLIVHVSSADGAMRLAALEGLGARLAERFWPGPLTLVVRARPGNGVAALATAGLATIALRVPAHPAMRALLAASDRPLAAPSANASGRISPTRADHVAASLGDAVPLIVDSGGTVHGLESTIVSVADGGLTLLRAGPITVEELEDAAQQSVSTHGSGTITAPGQLAAHYAPGAPVRLNATAAKGDEWLIGFGPVGGDATLSTTGSLVEAAARLFDALHEADASGRAGIAVAPIPHEGLGRAINDRLARAAVGSGGVAR